MILASLPEVRTKDLNLVLALSRVVLQPADNPHEVAFLALCLLDALFQGLHLRGRRRLCVGDCVELCLQLRAFSG